MTQQNYKRSERKRDSNTTGLQGTLGVVKIGRSIDSIEQIPKSQIKS